MQGSRPRSDGIDGDQETDATRTPPNQDPSGPPGGPRRTFSRSVTELGTFDADTVDLLFVIDNSESMAEEQRALADQFPRLIDILSTGEGW